MKDVIITIFVLCCLFFGLFCMFNFIVYVACLSSEGEPYFNRIVYACRFNDTIFTQQIIHSDISSDCYLNNVKVNCSDEVLRGLQVGGHYQEYTKTN